MKRKSDIAKHTTGDPSGISEMCEAARKEAKRTLTTVQTFQHSNGPSDQQEKSKRHSAHIFRKSEFVVDQFIDGLLEDMQKHFEEIDKKRTISSAVALTEVLGANIAEAQDPEVDFNDSCFKPEQEPQVCQTDPIGGFNREHFMPRQSSLSFMTKKMQENAREIQKIDEVYSMHQRKLPPLMKHLSNQKLSNQYIPLKDVSNEDKKVSSSALEDIFRDRLMKEVEHRIFKDKMEAQMSRNMATKTVSDKKGKSKRRESISMTSAKQDITYDYLGEKIPVVSNGKFKSNLKILKAMYKFSRERPEDVLKNNKLQKKVHERISFKARNSRVPVSECKSIHELSGANYSLSFKERLESELRRGKISFNEKDVAGREQRVLFSEES